MEQLSLDHLLDCGRSRHFASEPHMRIQVLDISNKAPDTPLFDTYHGELLIICLQGSVDIRTDGQTTRLNLHDQVLLVDGESFSFDPVSSEPPIIQFVWAPGMNPCRKCYEVYGGFFGTP